MEKSNITVKKNGTRASIFPEVFMIASLVLGTIFMIQMMATMLKPNEEKLMLNKKFDEYTKNIITSAPIKSIEVTYHPVMSQNRSVWWIIVPFSNTIESPLEIHESDLTIKAEKSCKKAYIRFRDVDKDYVFPDDPERKVSKGRYNMHLIVPDTEYSKVRENLAGTSSGNVKR